MQACAGAGSVSKVMLTGVGPAWAGGECVADGAVAAGVAVAGGAAPEHPVVAARARAMMKSD